MTPQIEGRETEDVRRTVDDVITPGSSLPPLPRRLPGPRLPAVHNQTGQYAHQTLLRPK